MKPHSSSLTSLENFKSNFGQSVQVCCRDEQNEENDNLEVFCVRRKHINVQTAFSQKHLGLVLDSELDLEEHLSNEINK